MNLRRAALALLALTLVTMGFEDARLRVRCPAPIEVSAGELPGRTEEGPLWVRLGAPHLPASPGLVTMDSGAWKEAWIAVASPGEPGTAIALARTESLDEARSLCARGGEAAIEGLSYFPPREVRGKAVAYVRSLGLRPSPSFRIIELGREPPGLLGSLGVLAAGAVILYASIFCRRRHPARREMPDTYELTPHESAPLPEETRQEVLQMLDDVWEKAKVA